MGFNSALKGLKKGNPEASLNNGQKVKKNFNKLITVAYETHVNILILCLSSFYCYYMFELFKVNNLTL